MAGTYLCDIIKSMDKIVCTYAKCAKCGTNNTWDTIDPTCKNDMSQIPGMPGQSYNQYYPVCPVDYICYNTQDRTSGVGDKGNLFSIYDIEELRCVGTRRCPDGTNPPCLPPTNNGCQGSFCDAYSSCADLPFTIKWADRSGDIETIEGVVITDSGAGNLFSTILGDSNITGYEFAPTVGYQNFRSGWWNGTRTFSFNQPIKDPALMIFNLGSSRLDRKIFQTQNNSPSQVSLITSEDCQIFISDSIQMPSSTTIDVTNSSSGAYLINGLSNPSISFIRGHKYLININALGHPFWIQTVSGSFRADSVYSIGITGGGADRGTIIFEVPFDAPNNLYYACQNHSSMAGSILVSGPIEPKGTKNRLIQSALEGGGDGIVAFPGTYSSITITCDGGSSSGWYKWGKVLCGIPPFIPKFGIPVPTDDGFTVQISNYTTSFEQIKNEIMTEYTVRWLQDGRNFLINDTGLVTVTGKAGVSSVLTIVTATTIKYAIGVSPSTVTTGSAQVKGTSLFAALTPIFEPTTRTSDGFTAQITNYDANYTWAGTATASGTVAINDTGLITVSNAAAGTSSTATITTTKANTVGGSALVTETSSLAAPLTPTFGSILAAQNLYPGNGTVNSVGEWLYTTNFGGATGNILNWLKVSAMS